jgi:hypothetical protein
LQSSRVWHSTAAARDTGAPARRRDEAEGTAGATVESGAGSLDATALGMFSAGAAERPHARAMQPKNTIVRSITCVRRFGEKDLAQMPHARST